MPAKGGALQRAEETDATVRNECGVFATATVVKLVAFIIQKSAAQLTAMAKKSRRASVYPHVQSRFWAQDACV